MSRQHLGNGVGRHGGEAIAVEPVPIEDAMDADDSDEELEGGPQAGAGHDERYPFGGLLSDIWRDRFIYEEI